MANHYNLYESLGLDRNSSTSELRETLTKKLDDLHASGAPITSGPVQETSTALKILGDDFRRGEYDKRLDDDSQPDITIHSIRALAAAPSPTEATPTPTATPSAQDPWAAPAAAAPAAPVKVPVDAPELAPHASIKDMWDRMPTIPRVVTGLLGATTIAGYLAILTAIYLVFSSVSTLNAVSQRNPLSLMLDSDAADATAFAGVSLLMTPLLVIIGMLLTLLPLYWIAAILRGHSNAAVVFFTASMSPMALLLTIAGLVGISTLSGILTLLIGGSLVASVVLVLLPDMRAWFRGQILVPAT